MSKVTFFVLAGPMCLLGKCALEQLWPAEYRALRQVTSASICTTQIETSSNPGMGPSYSLLSAANEVDNSRRHKEVCKIGNSGVGPSSSLLSAANEVNNSRRQQKV